MEYVLMNKDIETLRFDFDEPYIKVENNAMLPYAIKDFVLTTGEKDFKGSLGDISCLKDYLASRTLNLSRENAKVILNVTALPQTLKTDERLKIVFACSGLSMQDNFWIKKRHGDNRKFDDVCLRKRHLSDASYDIAILGRHISATAEELSSDLTTEGMFPKFWHKTDSNVELWKTDKTGGKVNATCEVLSSNILEQMRCSHIDYRLVEKDGMIFSVCPCIANDTTSLVPIQDIMDWHNHIKRGFPKELEILIPSFYKDFANMCVADYILGNTDRHSGNWGVLTDENNKIVSLSPIYDLNQALVSDMLKTRVDIESLVYEPTKTTFDEAVNEWAPYSDLAIDKTQILSVLDGIETDRIAERIDTVQKIKSKNLE